MEFGLEYLHKDKSRQVIGLIYDVRNKMGSGWSEDNYHQALLHHIKDQNIPVLSKPRFPLLHREAEIYRFEPDLIVWDQIILELKVHPKFKGDSFPSVNEAQLIHYLKRCKKELGLLVNFAHSKVGLKRMAFQPPKPRIVEVYDYIKPKISSHDRSILKEVRKHLLSVSYEYGTGYPNTVYQEILELELAHYRMKYKTNVVADAIWDGKKIGSNIIPHLLIEDRILVLIRASFKHSSTLDFTSTESYLRALGLNIGIVVNFGRNRIQINGVAV